MIVASQNIQQQSHMYAVQRGNFPIKSAVCLPEIIYDTFQLLSSIRY